MEISIMFAELVKDFGLLTVIIGLFIIISTITGLISYLISMRFLKLDEVNHNYHRSNRSVL